VELGKDGHASTDLLKSPITRGRGEPAGKLSERIPGRDGDTSGIYWPTKPRYGWDNREYAEDYEKVPQLSHEQHTRGHIPIATKRHLGRAWR